MEPDSLKKAVLHCDDIFKSKHFAFHQDFSRVLIINLSEEKAETADIPEDWVSSYVSGPCLGARIWSHFYDEEENPSVVLTAPAARSGSVVSVAFKGSTSKRLVFNTIKGDFAQKIANCRFSAIVIKGRLRRQGVIALSAGGASLELTDSLRQKSTSEVFSLLNADAYTSCLAIGPSGENGVSFSSCVVDNGDFTGRYGLGAVLGEKNIKAITVTAVSEKAEHEVNLSKIPFVSIADYKGWAPVENFTKRSDPRLFHLSESEFLRIYGGTSQKLPSFSARMMLGSNTGCYNLRKVVERYNLCTELGLDPISVGSILGCTMRGVNDNEKVCDYITSLSKQGVPVNYIKIGSEPCGPYDYRGNFVQALSDVNGNWFPVLFNSNRLLCLNHHDFWASLSEDIILGLESFGLDSSCMLGRVRKVDIARAFLFKHSTGSADRYFSPEEQAEVLSKQFKTNLVGQDIVDLGRTCKRVIYEINKALGAEQIRLPDCFCVEPESNHSKNEVVPIFALNQAYLKRRNRLFALQDSVLRKN